MVLILQLIGPPMTVDLWHTIGKALSEQDALSVLPLLPEGKYKIVEHK